MIIYLLSCFGLAFLSANADGPFNIFSIIRYKLINNKYIGVTIHNLINCYFCLGIYASIIMYFTNFYFNFINYILAGASACFIIKRLIQGNNEIN